MKPKNPALIVSVGAAVACAAVIGLSAAGAGTGATPTPVAATKAEAIPFIGAPNYRAIVAANRAAVVGITTVSKGGDTDDNDGDDSGQGNVAPGWGNGGNDRNNPFGDIPFFRFFPGPNPQLPPQTPQRALGSGFIVSPNGVILTNAHVVDDADEVTVKLTDKREFKAKVIGIDKPSDVAVLQIKAHDLPYVRIGDPQQVRVGEWVVAIGSPFGFENSVTAGIVSAKSRSLPDDNYVPFLQTDVPINPGNSGGPLFDLNGDVIGINSQIYSQSGGYQGLSFSIPIDVAMKVEKQLVDHGRVSRGRLGVMIQEVDQDLANSFGLPKTEGALVSSVDKDSPAEKAGIKPGDVILKFNGVDVASSRDLPAMVADVTPGDSAKMEVWHDGKAREVTVNVGEMKFASNDETPAKGAKGGLGLAVRPMTPDERKDASVSEGLVVEDVEDGPAAKAGIQSGDVILSVNGEKVGSADKLRSLVSRHGKNVALLVMRGNNKMFVPIQLG